MNLKEYTQDYTSKMDDVIFAFQTDQQAFLQDRKRWKGDFD